MINLLDINSNVVTLLNSIKQSEKITVFGCDLDAKLTILNEIGKFLLFPIFDTKEAITVKEKLEESGYRVAELIDKLSFEPNPFENDYNEHVLKVLNGLLGEEFDALIVNPMFFYYNLPNVDWLTSKSLYVKKGAHIDINHLVSCLNRAGLTRTDFVCKSGDYNKKGEIVEIYLDRPYRLYFDFDEIESIKVFNSETLLNEEEVDELNIGNMAWVENPEEVLMKLPSQIKNEVEKFGDKLANMLCLTPYLDYVNSTIFDYLPNDAVVSILDNKPTFEYLQAELKEFAECIFERFHKKINTENVLDKTDFAVVGFQYITNSNRLFRSTKVFNIKCTPVTNYRTQNHVLIADLKRFLAQGYTVLIYAKNKEGVVRIANLLGANHVRFNQTASLSKVSKNEINILSKRKGMSINLELERIVVISSDNLFGVQKQQLTKSIKTETIDFLPEKGEFVVHNTHGIGKCMGVERLKLSGSERDYVVVEYKNADRLYLPVENIDSLSKFVGDKNPPLNKLGSGEFAKTKERVRNNVKELAIDLIKLYGERESLKGYVYSPDDEIQKQFEESFGYTETADQFQAVMDIKNDMMSGKVMDRLICGDVGFGKTEVALRGAFKTIMNGKQVAFLCPTTILSEQHYNTCLYRMKEFGVNVAVLNRFCSNSRVSEVLAGLKNGDIDIVVGTHKLLNKKVEFKNLGLLILDEEQKFGVGDKEKIKEIRKQVNVITLSATPIPRTLNMALIGVRDISVIDTPPVLRIPTQTQVVEYSDNLVKTAIAQELDRMGQVLIVFNRVEGIYEYASKIRNMFDGVRVGVTHGQMDEKTLEDEIFKLYNGETQILVSTTLIENGIDLPNANTLIVVDADMLGLSQLYQLKGRVGRSDRQAYAYFTFNGRKMLNETAYKRLEAISEYSAMGSGYKIALKDLEIRGAGKLFGAEQHGHIEKVGYAMYLKLLSEAVGEIKGQKVLKHSDVRIVTALNAFLPYDYIENQEQRMAVYMKISKICSVGELNKCVSELSEIYGEVPEEVSNLCKIAYIKNLASVRNVESVVINPSKSKIVFLSDVSIKEIVEAVKYFNGLMVLEASKSPIINLRKDISMEETLSLIINFLEILAD